MRHQTNPSRVPVDLLDRAEAALVSDPRQAAKMASVLLELEPGNARAMHILGESLASRGQVERGAELLRKAVRLDGRLADLSSGAPAEDGVTAWIGRFKPAPCPVCSSPGGTPVWVGNLSRSHNLHHHIDPVRVWVRCDDCSLVRVERPVPPAVLKSWKKACDLAPAAPPTPQEFAEQVAKDDALITMIREEGYGNDWVERSTRDLPQPSVLEVGAGWGSFLAAAGWRGFETVGLEPDLVKARWAAAHVDAEVHGGRIEDGLPEGPFDVVVVRAPLDQMEAPMRALHGLARQLVPGGLMALTVDTLDHPVHLLRGPRDPLWTTPRRRTWFERRSLAVALLRNGLQPVKMVHDPNRPGAATVLARRDQS